MEMAPTSQASGPSSLSLLSFLTRIYDRKKRLELAIRGAVTRTEGGLRGRGMIIVYEN